VQRLPPSATQVTQAAEIEGSARDVPQACAGGRAYRAAVVRGRPAPPLSREMQRKWEISLIWLIHAKMEYLYGD
jgi:hypothetical protein